MSSRRTSKLISFKCFFKTFDYDNAISLTKICFHCHQHHILIAISQPIPTFFHHFKIYLAIGTSRLNLLANKILKAQYSAKYFFAPLKCITIYAFLVMLSTPPPLLFTIFLVRESIYSLPTVVICFKIQP